MKTNLASWAVTAVMIACLGVGVSGVVAACTQQQRQSVKDNVIDCAKQDQAVVVSVIVEMTTAILSWTAPDWPSIEALAIRAGREIGGCALASVVDDWVRQHVPTGPTSSLAESAETGAAVLTLQRFRRDHAGGATFRWRGRDL